MRLADLGIGEQGAQQRRGLLLIRVGTGLVNPRVERRGRTAHGLEAHRGGGVRRAPQDPGVVHQQRRQPGLGLRAVDERQTLLRFQRDRFEPLGSQRRAVLPLPDHGEREVREGGEISRRPDAPLRGDARMHLRVQHADDQLRKDRAHPARAAQQHVGAQQHHRPHGVDGQRFSHAGCVAADQIQLQIARLVGLDAHMRQLAEARVDAIDRVAPAHGGLDGPAGGSDARQSLRRDRHGRDAAGDGDDVRDREGMAVECDRGRHAAKIDAQTPRRLAAVRCEWSGRPT